MKTSTSVINNSFMCHKIDSNQNIVMIIVFLLSFLLFKFILNRPKLTAEEKSRRQIQKEHYFRIYQSENEEFFIPNQGEN